MEKLYLTGTKTLKTLPLRLPDLTLGVNYTFPYLQHISVEYAAHCCLVSDQNIRRVSGFLRSPNKRHSSHIERRSSSMFACLNTTSGDLVTNYTPGQNEIFDNLTELCSGVSHCFDGRCHDNCQGSLGGGSGDQPMNTPQIVCIQEAPSPTATASTPSSFGFQSVLFTTICKTSSAPILTPTPTPTPTPPPPPSCPIPNHCITTNCGPPCTLICPHMCNKKRSVREHEDAVKDTAISHLEQRRSLEDDQANCSVVAVTATTVCVTPSPSLSQTPHQPSQSIMCSVVYVPLAPTASNTAICFTVTHTASPSQTLQISSESLLSPSETPTFAAPSPIASSAEEKVVEIICSTIEVVPMPSSITNEPTPFPSIMPSNAVTNPIDTPICADFIRIAAIYSLSNETVVCEPGNDAFNPCNDIFESTVLRVAVWAVILVILVGNGTVILVTVLHLIIHYRQRQKKAHVMFLLYLNLAFADFIMGVYLITIASEDLVTIGKFSEFAVEWQTGFWCQFAGFCAILSSIMSVFTLLVITVERVYTIRFALESRQLKNRQAAFIMMAGWLVAITIAVLPTIGMSSYDRVSICLPFETRGVEDIIYIVIVLFLTGAGTLLILLCYIYIFYLVTCSGRKKRLHGTTKFKEEVCLAFRMCILVVTNFACWGPIALFATTALFGHDLIGVEGSKVVMVVVFPINSCLNPILYSFSTKTFRYNLCNLLSKCGLFKSYNTRRRIQQSSGGVAESSERRGTISRRGSLMTMLISMSTYNGNSRRNSALSGTSGSSLEDGTTIQNPCFSSIPHGYHRPSITSTDSNISSGDEEDRLPMPVTVTYLRQARASVGSLSGLVSGLQAVPEERECDTHSTRDADDEELDNTQTETVVIHRWSLNSAESADTELKYSNACREKVDISAETTENKLECNGANPHVNDSTIFSNPYLSRSPMLSSKKHASNEVHPENQAI